MFTGNWTTSATTVAIATLFAPLSVAIATAPNVAHLSTKERERVLLCERVNGRVELELRARGYAGASLEGMCMFGELQPTRWYSCMDSQMSKNVLHAKAASVCRHLRVEPNGRPTVGG